MEVLGRVPGAVVRVMGKGQGHVAATPGGEEVDEVIGGEELVVRHHHHIVWQCAMSPGVAVRVARLPRMASHALRIHSINNDCHSINKVPKMASAYSLTRAVARRSDVLLQGRG